MGCQTEWPKGTLNLLLGGTGHHSLQILGLPQVVPPTDLVRYQWLRGDQYLLVLYLTHMLKLIVVDDWGSLWLVNGDAYPIN